MKRLGRDAAEITALADHLSAHGLVLEMLAGPLPGRYDPAGSGRMLFAFFAAMGETGRENIREATLEGLDAAARKGKHGGRPAVIRPDLIIPAGRRKGQSPSVASTYRALAEREETRAYPDTVEQAKTEYAHLTGGAAGVVRPRQDDDSADAALDRRLAQLPPDSRPGPPSLEQYDQLLIQGQPRNRTAGQAAARS